MSMRSFVPKPLVVHGEWGRCSTRRRVLHALSIAVLLGAVSVGCAHPVKRVDVDDPRSDVVINALAMLGTPYQYGGGEPHQGFDCSGLVNYSYRQAGLEVPRTAALQLKATRSVPVRELKPGDLLFFRIGGRRIDHVGIYLGDGRFVHAPATGSSVSKSSLSDKYWRKRFYRAGSLME